MIVVSDTTPLNYLILIDQAHLLQELYSFVVIQQAVHSEMQRADTPVEVREWIDNRPNWLELRSAPSLDLNLKLGAGEREAITLALELKAKAILLDDRKARIEAQNRAHRHRHTGYISYGGASRAGRSSGSYRAPAADQLSRPSESHSIDSGPRPHKQRWP